MSSAPSTARSWLPTRQSVAALADQVGAGVGLGAVADHVAEAPDLLDAGLVDRREDGLERGQVGVDVGDHGDAHGGQRTRCRLAAPYDGDGDRDRLDRRAALGRRARPRAPCATASRPAPSPPSTARRSPSWATTAPTRRCCSPRRWARTRATSPSASAPSWSASSAPSGSVERIEVAGPGLRQPLPLRRLVPARDGAPGRRRREPRAGADRLARADPGRVRLRQPDRAAARRRRPPRRLRRRPGPPAGGGRPRGRARVLRQRRRRPGRALRRLDRRPDDRRASRPRTATKATTSPSWPSGSRPRGSTRPTPRRSGAAGSS